MGMTNVSLYCIAGFCIIYPGHNLAMLAGWVSDAMHPTPAADQRCHEVAERRSVSATKSIYGSLLKRETGPQIARQTVENPYGTLWLVGNSKTLI